MGTERRKELELVLFQITREAVCSGCSNLRWKELACMTPEQLKKTANIAQNYLTKGHYGDFKLQNMDTDFQESLEWIESVSNQNGLCRQQAEQPLYEFIPLDLLKM